jgi:processive 1,2-diacylglycerol beta-glucosyltransferase
MAFNGRCALKTPPSQQEFRIVYGAYAPVQRVCADVKAIQHAFPQAHITLLTGSRYRAFAGLQNDRVSVIKRTDDMPSLFEKAHLYIGKAGAATMYEAYSMNLPVIVNYSLPGQEQGNIALLQQDACGRFVDTTPDLLLLLQKLLADNAAMWQSWRAAMISANRKAGAEHIMDDIRRRFFV